MAVTTAKQRIAQELNSHKRMIRGAICQLHNVHANSPHLDRAFITTRLQLLEKLMLEALQIRANKAGIVGNYKEYQPFEETRYYKRMLRKEKEKEQSK